MKGNLPSTQDADTAGEVPGKPGWVGRWIRLSTFSSRALWCSNSDLRAFSTSTSLETPEGDWAWRFTTVTRSDRSWRDTRHSRCSRSSWQRTKEGEREGCEQCPRAVSRVHMTAEQTGVELCIPL